MLVEERKWISEPRFLHALNFCMLLPGPEAQQLATYVGWLLHGTRGGLVAGTLFVLPGLAVILGLSALYAAFHETGWLDTLFFGLKAAVLAIVFEAVVRIGRRALKTRLAVAIAAIAFVAIFVLGVPFPVIVIGAGLFGYLATRVSPDAAGAAGQGRPRAEEVRPMPVSTASNRRLAARGAGHGAVALALWAAPVVLLGLVLGFDTVFTADRAVLLLAGGGDLRRRLRRARLRRRRGRHHLRLARPGRDARRPRHGRDHARAADHRPLLRRLHRRVPRRGRPRPDGGGAASAACSPPGSPSCRASSGSSSARPTWSGSAATGTSAGALAAITAAVVGVILNLALWLGLHVLFREVGILDLGSSRPAWPVWSTLDPWALGLMLVAGVALFRFHLGVPATLAICALLGVAIRAAGFG